MIRFESHYQEPRGPLAPQNFVPALRDGERVVNVETIKDAFGHEAARVWIEGPDG